MLGPEKISIPYFHQFPTHKRTHPGVIPRCSKSIESVFLLPTNPEISLTQDFATEQDGEKSLEDLLRTPLQPKTQENQSTWWTCLPHDDVSFPTGTPCDEPATTIPASHALMEDARKPQGDIPSRKYEPNSLYAFINDFDGEGDGPQSAASCASWTSPPRDHVSAPTGTPCEKAATPNPASQTPVEDERKPPLSSSTPQTVLDGGRDVGKDPEGSVKGFVMEQPQAEHTPPSNARRVRRSRPVVRKPSTCDAGYDSAAAADDDDGSDSDYCDLATPPHHTRAGPSRRMTTPAGATPRPAHRVHKPRTTKGVPPFGKSSRKTVYTMDSAVSKSVREEHSRLNDNLPTYPIKLPIDTGIKGPTRFHCTHKDEYGRPCTKEGSATSRETQALRHALTHHDNLRWVCGNPACRQLFARVDPVKRHRLNNLDCKNSLPRGTTMQTEAICITVEEVRLVDGESRVFAAHPVQIVYHK